MAKNIVLLSDGTGNSAAKLFKTNVWRLYQALDLSDGAGQVAYYDDGVGTSTFRPLALLGGALGFGLKRNVKQLYTFLCRNYEPGDRIYAFGFSRGAFTIRVLAGMIASQGVVPGRTMPPDVLHTEVEKAYKADRRDYKTKWRHWGKSAETATQTEPTVPPGRSKVSIEFLGLWDTVDAYGLPVDELKRGLDYWWLGLSFPDQDLSPIVKRACHALALDDERRTFHPVLWNEDFEKKLAGKVAPDRLKQVWFAGMHSNAGGGYAKDGLAHVSLRWMVNEARKAELKFHKTATDEFERLANPHDTMGDSRAGLSAYYRYDPRRLSVLCNDTYNKVKIEQPKIHHSVLDRIARQHVRYVPHVIPGKYDVVGPDGAVTTARYEQEADAQAREADLERAWDLVWWRRVVYFATVAFTAALAVLPWSRPVTPDAVCSGRLCFVEPVLVAVGKFLPDLAQTWLTPFRVHISPFLALALGLGLSMAFGFWLDRRIAARASEAWAHLTGVRFAGPRRWGPLSRVARTFRTSRPMVSGYRWFARTALPFLFFVATVVALLFGANRLLFEIVEAAGGTCTPSPASDVKPLPSGSVTLGSRFETRNPCFATKVRLEKGATYDVALTVRNAWIDGTHPTAPSGFTSADGGWVFRASVPLRRSWTADWFQAIARVGHLGRDRHQVPPRHDPATGAYVLRFTARTDGELFLFANDAVLALPGLWSFFYDGAFDDSALPNAGDRTRINNKGTAEVTVTRILPPAH